MICVVGVPTLARCWAGNLLSCYCRLAHVELRMYFYENGARVPISPTVLLLSTYVFVTVRKCVDYYSHTYTSYSKLTCVE